MKQCFYDLSIVIHEMIVPATVRKTHCVLPLYRGNMEL